MEFIILVCVPDDSLRGVRYEEPDGASRTCLFLIPPSGALESVEILAKKSHRNIVFESEEARRRLQGRK